MDENPYKSPSNTEVPARTSLPIWLAVAAGAGGVSFLLRSLGLPAIYVILIVIAVAILVSILVSILVRRHSFWLLRNDPAHRVGRALLKANRELSRIRPNPGRALEALAPYRDESSFDAVVLASGLHGQLKGLVWAVIGDAYREAGEWSLACEWYRRAGDRTEFCCFADPYADMVVLQKMEGEYPAALGYLRRYDAVVATTPNVDWFIWFIRRACSLDWLRPSHWRFVRRKRMVRATLEEYERRLIARSE